MRHPRGFTLLELMVGMAVLLVGAVGALSGLLAAASALREGQLRLQKQALVDATLQRARLQNKEQLRNAAVAVAAAPDMPQLKAIGAGGWVMDPTPVVAGDLSTGALFIVRPSGVMRHCTAATEPACPAGAITNCADADLPLGVFCREVHATRTAATFAPGGIVPAGSFVTTRWVRVLQQKPSAVATDEGAVLGHEVFAR